MGITSAIKKEATEIGFDACGIALCRPLREQKEPFECWINNGYNAGMHYMEDNLDKRIDPTLLIKDTRSVIVCLLNYRKDKQQPEEFPRIASYARSVDYHFFMKAMLNRLLDFILALLPETTGRAFVDSAPVMERNWAVEAGLGWIGKNSLLIHPVLGSQVFIGTILLTAELDEYDSPFGSERCGECDMCIRHCPGGAIIKKGIIDANRCLSYQTIENRLPVPEYLIPALGNRLFGCDTCLDVCPWNIKKEPSGKIYGTTEELFNLSAQEWLSMGSGEFKRRFGPTPLSRCGLKK